MKDRSNIYRKRILDIFERFEGSEITIYSGAVKAAFSDEEWSALVATRPELTIALTDESDEEFVFESEEGETEQ